MILAGLWIGAARGTLGFRFQFLPNILLELLYEPILRVYNKLRHLGFSLPDPNKQLMPVNIELVLILSLTLLLVLVFIIAIFSKI